MSAKLKDTTKPSRRRPAVILTEDPPPAIEAPKKTRTRKPKLAAVPDHTPPVVPAIEAPSERTWTVAEAVAAVKTGVATLAAYCNGATTLDGMGFSRDDAEMGHSFAGQIAAGGLFTEKQIHAMRRLCNRYRRQLVGVVDVPPVEALPALPAPVQMRDAVESGGTYIRFGRFNPEWNTFLKAAARSLGTYATWRAEPKLWYVPDADAATLGAKFTELCGVEVTG